MKRVLSIICAILLLSSSFTFADTVATTEASTEVSKDNQDKLNNMKKSDVQKFVEFDPNTENSDVSMTEGVNNIDRQLGVWWRAITYVLAKYSRVVVIIISAFFFALFFIFKHLKNKAAQKSAAIFVVVPIVAYIIYLYLNPFLMSLQ